MTDEREKPPPAKKEKTAKIIVPTKNPEAAKQAIDEAIEADLEIVRRKTKKKLLTPAAKEIVDDITEKAGLAPKPGPEKQTMPVEELTKAARALTDKHQPSTTAKDLKNETNQKTT